MSLILTKNKLIMDNSGVMIFLLILRIVITVYCNNKAKELNRSAFGWSFFGFCIPILALIWIQFMKPILIFEKEN